MDKTKIALGFRPAMPEIKALSHKMTFGKYRGQTVEDIIKIDPGYILYLSDEKIAIVSETILNYADEADMDQRFSEALDDEFRGMNYHDFLADGN